MEKKGSRNLQPSSRGLATDSKKNQDGASGKPWPRGGRRRESTGSSLSTKNEPSRKPQPQRVKTIDKRPRARGGFNSNVARSEASRLSDQQEAELGSVFLPGSKKQSLNHLLNFVYTPRESAVPEQRGHAKPGNRMINTKKHKYNKEHFLQANCQFIVNQNGDYKQYMNNPDALVDWNLIEQVNIQVTEFPSCPICLYQPMAAKITRCGHIYCWSCILHYLALSDKPWRKCPICYEAVHKKDLKSVVTIPHATFNSNETITFKLMKRLRGSLVAYPADFTIKDDNMIFNMSEKEATETYSKLLLANNSDIMSIINRESKELLEQIAEDENRPEKCFIEQAIALLKERELTIFEGLHDKLVQENVVCDQLENSLGQLELNEIENKNELIEDPNISENGQPTKYFYFYQASDGQHIYLHAINARMLEHTYGSLEFGPKTISGKILEKEGGSMTEDLRKRLRYLQHLPVTCQFEVAEIQLRQPVVTKDTLEHFHEQIEIRRKRRQRRSKEEKRREKRITEEENRKMGQYPAPNIHLESHFQFPVFGEFEDRTRTESETTLPSERSSSPDLGLGTSLGSVPLENEYSGPSFATMLATKKKSVSSWPVLKSSTVGYAMPLKLINVTGSDMKMKVTARRNSESDVEPEDYEPVPAFNTSSIGDAIAEALQKIEGVDESSPVGKKKKKKNKQKVLFTTTMALPGN